MLAVFLFVVFFCLWYQSPPGTAHGTAVALAINSHYLEEEASENPGVVYTLLYGNCDPDEFGQPEISPLAAAARIMDSESVSLLLYSEADPNRAARCQDRLIFIAIDRSDVPSVQALVTASC